MISWLAVFGLLHAYLLWYGDVLFSYAICGLVAFPLWRRGPAVQGGVAVLGISLALALQLGLAHHVTNQPLEEVAKLRAEIWDPPPDAVAAEEAAYRGSYLEQMPVRVA